MAETLHALAEIFRDHAAVAAEDGNQDLADVLREVAERVDAEH